MPTPSLTFAESALGPFWSGLLAGLEDPQAPATARATQRAWRTARGFAGSADVLTLPTAQAKLGKSKAFALGLMLTPATGLDWGAWGLSRPVNLCPRASKGCAAACLATSGKGRLSSVQRARQARTAFLLEHPFETGVLIGAEVRKATRSHDDITLRLNVTSDIRWELLPGAAEGMRALQRLGVRAYDYTAMSPKARAMAVALGWDLTYSAKEPEHTPDEVLAAILAGGGRVAMPFRVARGAALPEWHALAGRVFRVIDGDLSDDRTADPQGVIVGLRVKGLDGAADTSGFIRDANHGTVSPALALA